MEGLTGQKIILRRAMDSDADFLAFWYRQPEVMRKCGFQHAYSKEELIHSFKIFEQDPTRDWFVLAEKSENRILGETGLLRINPDWYCCNLSIPSDRHKGYGKEVVIMLLDRAFSYHRLNRVALATTELNQEAICFYRKLGFQQEGILEKGYYEEGQFYNFLLFRMLKSEFLLNKNLK